MKYTVSLIALFLSLNSMAQPLIVTVKDGFPMPGIGYMVTGRIESGVLKKGSRVEVKGTSDQVYNLEVQKIYINNKEVNEGEKGKEVNLVFNGEGEDKIWRGMIVSEPGYYKTVTEVKAKIYLVEESQGGKPIAVDEKLSVQVVRFGDLMEFANLATSKKHLKPGDEMDITLLYTKPSAVSGEEPFLLLHNGKIIAKGKFKIEN